MTHPKKQQQQKARKAARSTSKAQEPRESKLSLNLQNHWKLVSEGTATAAANSAAFNATTTAVPVNANYHAVAAECKARVEAIAAACRKQNIRFRDRFFDLKFDQFDCLNSLSDPDKESDVDFESIMESAVRNSEGVVERIPKLFDKPTFFKNGGMLPGDIQQGYEGDCWFLAALSILASDPGLLLRTIVARDEKVGVYGFVFFRDGQWISSIVDDQLATTYEDFRVAPTNLKKEEYDKTFLRGSKALKFAKCNDPNETWVPLIEKAYAKAHGDYESICGGNGGEAVEDLTGGICTTFQIEDILDTDKFWNQELLQMHKGKVFFLSMFYDTQGIHAAHEYCVLRAIEVQGKRFLLIRNPWGKSEWTGRWSDGSAEWTGEWMTLLNHKFGDDGQFWMEYSDVLALWDRIKRTTLFDDSWSVVKSHVELEAEFPANFSSTAFDITTTRDGPVTFVLSQIDTRYFTKLEGEYEYTLTFQIVHLSEDSTETAYAHPPTTTFSYLTRSTFIEIEHLPAGKYRLYPKVSASPLGRSSSTDDVILLNGAKGRQAKVEKQLRSMTLAKQIPLLRTQKLRKAALLEAQKRKESAAASEDEEVEGEAEDEDECEEEENEEDEDNQECEKELEEKPAKEEEVVAEKEAANEVVVLETTDKNEVAPESKTLVVEVVEVAQTENAKTEETANVVEEEVVITEAKDEEKQVEGEKSAATATAVPSSARNVVTATTVASPPNGTEEPTLAEVLQLLASQEQEASSINFDLSVSTFLRVYSKDSKMTVTTRFLDLEVDNFKLPECLNKPDGADPTADLYLSADFLSDFHFEGVLGGSTTQLFLKQKTAIAERSGTSSVLKAMADSEQE
ncbi:hypothetical protein BDR26DRAFT_870487 [Obelidium mucronatum]|nr:hypothetical protein BDR26DRAFT_870487 [Obelidium mucronatum]